MTVLPKSRFKLKHARIVCAEKLFDITASHNALLLSWDIPYNEFCFFCFFFVFYEIRAFLQARDRERVSIHEHEKTLQNDFPL